MFLELVKRAKNDVTQEHMQSLADLMVLKDRPYITVARTFLVSNITQAGFHNLDFGWGPPVYGGSAIGGLDEALPGVVSFLNSYKNGKGEQGILVSICLPNNAMALFIKELRGLLSHVPTHPIAILSSL
ncbi:Benzyl alcohol O-benzoyltransferase [Bienertia sinuspersici]